MGLFDENIEVLDMPDELLELMGEEMKKFNNLFDEYLISDDSSLVKEIVNISKSTSSFKDNSNIIFGLLVEEVIFTSYFPFPLLDKKYLFPSGNTSLSI